MEWPQKLRDARFLLLKNRPYLAAMLFAMKAYATQLPNGAMAVDSRWNLYYDPEQLERFTPRQIAAALYHEVWHLLARHFQRLVAYPSTVANLGSDMAINSWLLSEGMELPTGIVLPALFELPEGKSAEFYCDELVKRGLGQSQSRCGQSREGKEHGQPDASEQSSSGQEEQSAQSECSAQSSDQGQQGQGPNPSSGADSSDQQGAGKGNGSDPSNQSQSQSGNADSSAGQASRPADGWDGLLGDEHGSCAHGHRLPYEVDDGLDEAQQRCIEQEVARAIQEHQKRRETVPSHLKRWAEDVLQPKINWRAILRTRVRSALSTTISGAVDYSWQGRNRRQCASSVILPVLKAPIPRVGILIDTSGSMSDEELGQALAEVRQALRYCPSVRVYSADVELHTARTVFRSSQVELVGGGGTSMRRAVQQITQDRRNDTPSLLVVITDGYTDWPDPVPGLKVVAALTNTSQRDRIPPHIEVVDISQRE